MEPRTAAGKRLVTVLFDGPPQYRTILNITGFILDVEAEAASPATTEPACVCGGPPHVGECHFGWHKAGCAASPAATEGTGRYRCPNCGRNEYGCECPGASLEYAREEDRDG